MGLLDNLRGKVTGEATPEENRATLANFTNTMLCKPKSASEVEAQLDIGVNNAIINPEYIREQIESLRFYTVTVKRKRLVYKEINGQLIPTVEEVDETETFERAWVKTLALFADKIWTTRWLSTYEADTLKLECRTLFHDIHRDMSLEDKRKYGTFVRVILTYFKAAIEGMKEGRIPLLVKVKTEEMKVTMKQAVNEKGNKK